MLTIGSLDLTQRKWFIILILKFLKLSNFKMTSKSISVGLYLKIKNNELSFVRDKILLKENQGDQDLQESKHDFLKNIRIKLKKMIWTNKVRWKWLKVWHYKFGFRQLTVTCVKSNNPKKKSITNSTNNMSIFTEQRWLKIRDTFIVFRKFWHGKFWLLEFLSF